MKHNASLSGIGKFGDPATSTKIYYYWYIDKRFSTKVEQEHLAFDEKLSLLHGHDYRDTNSLLRL